VQTDIASRDPAVVSSEYVEAGIFVEFESAVKERDG